nr:small, acid-soluble spore protein, alpha/beta type [Bacillus subtilis]
MPNNNSPNTNNLLLPTTAQAIDQIKLQIPSQFPVNLPPHTTSPPNPSVAGHITKRLLSFTQQSMSGEQF